MPKTVCLQLLAFLAILSWNFADAKALEESDDEVLTLEKRDEALEYLQKAETAAEVVLTKRDPENQEEEKVLTKRDPENQEDEEEEEVVEKRDPENQEEEDKKEEVVEKRDPENQEEEEEEVLTKRDPENQEDEEEEEEVVEKRDPENQEEEDKKEEVVEKRDPENQEEEEEEEKERETEYQDEQAEQENNFDEVLEKREPEEEAQEETAVEEKREDAEQSESEASEVEDLETRAVQARFTLVDYRGRRINGQREGLLLFSGGTVCDDHFNWNSAHAICKTMGYSGASHYRNGLVYGSFQSRKRIGLDNVICSSTHWAACRSTPNHNCNHREDILLTCRGTGFKLVNSAGSLVTGRREGLLTYQHGTVCDDYFNMNSAHAICRVMGYAYAVRWRRGYRYGRSQSHRRIVMDDVRCRSSYWNYCSYHTRHNCGHYEDVFLTCQPGTTHPHGFRLVDWRGATAARGCEALLLYNGGTVCDDYFNMNAAHAICRVMGFRSATRYRNGLAYGTMQTRKSIRMDNVRCSSTTWSSCRFSTRHNCSHGEDILLTCRA